MTSSKTTHNDTLPFFSCSVDLPSKPVLASWLSFYFVGWYSSLFLFLYSWLISMEYFLIYSLQFFLDLLCDVIKDYWLAATLYIVSTFCLLPSFWPNGFLLFCRPISASLLDHSWLIIEYSHVHSSNILSSIPLRRSWNILSFPSRITGSIFFCGIFSSK